MRSGRHRREPLATCLSLALGAALGFVAGAASGQPSLTTAVKASYLTKLAPFVAWPASVRPLSGPVTICVIGKDPFGVILDRAVSSQIIDGRTMTVTRLATVQAGAPCDIAFLGGSRSQGVKEALRVLHGAPVLTVTDGAEARGIIDFVVVDGRVRFRVDDQFAADGGLTISSKLLTLALAVYPRRDSTGHDSRSVR